MVAYQQNQTRGNRPSVDSRRQAVLSTIIREHLITGEAVGSHTVSQNFAYASGWSSATVRNVMGELEEFGLLAQPHTSAGRIPTDKGYRYYVDNMLADERLSKADLKTIERIGFDGDALTRPNRLMEKASHVLSQLSENVGIVVWPSLAENRLRHIRFVRLPDNRILVVLMSTSNIVHDKVIRMDEQFAQDELDHTARYLNAEFGGKTLSAIRAEIVELMNKEKALYDRLLRNAIILCERSLDDESGNEEVFIDGTLNILTKPEFASAEKIRELFRTLEEKSRLVSILNECISSNSAGGVRVRIGRENLAPSMKRCTVITASYSLGDDTEGALAVLGPTRIEYGRMMAVVNYLARFIERALASESPLQ